jgi:mercuric ion transport protein
MNDRALLGTGIIGGIVAALCCATPVLAIVLGAVGLSAWLAWADYVLLPLLVLCLGLTAYALWHLQHRTRKTSTPQQPSRSRKHP